MPPFSKVEIKKKPAVGRGKRKLVFDEEMASKKTKPIVSPPLPSAPEPIDTINPIKLEEFELSKLEIQVKNFVSKIFLKPLSLGLMYKLYHQIYL